MKCIVLAGGSGGSLWPLSRKNYPIQFVEIREGRSVFQENIARHLPYCDEFYIFTNSDYKYIVEGQLEVFQELNYKLFVEEEAVNTTLPVILGLMYAGESENVMVIGCSSVYSGNGFRQCLMEAVDIPEDWNCILFGMPVNEYNPNVGYIKYENNNVELFVEKPEEKLFNILTEKGNWLYNTGKYIMNSRRFIEYLKREKYDIYNGAREAFNNCVETAGIIKIPKGYKTYNLNKSFEKNILSSISGLKVKKLECVEWNVVSNWKSIEKIIKQNALNDVVKQGCENVTVINNAENKMVVANGLENITIVNTDDAVYIEGDYVSTDVKSFFIDYENDYRNYINYNNVRYRVWGRYKVLNKGKGYVVKEVTVYPGKEMSLHKHGFRSEHWAIVEGTAEITINEDVKEYSENTSVFVPKGAYHKIANNTNKNVVIIETEIGGYINERDIVSKNYKRKEDEINEPIKLRPIFKDYLWGGTRLRDEFNKDCNWDIIAESWEMSTHSAGNSIVDSGVCKGMTFGEFINKYGESVVGWKCRAFSKFPILIKLIDSKQALSVQVHPDDDFAMAVENEYGKNEMWYIIDCDEDAYIYCGFNKDISKEEFEQRLRNKSVTDILNKIHVKKGDSYFIPAGTVHAIGKGILICEVQQNSNSTYRIYDYDRKDKNGNLRELHIEKAIKVMDMNKYIPYANEAGETSNAEECVLKKLCACKYFEVAVNETDNSTEIFVDESSFYAVVTVEGKGTVYGGETKINIEKGDTVFLPAGIGNVKVEGSCKTIIVHI